MLNVSPTPILAEYIPRIHSSNIKPINFKKINIRAFEAVVIFPPLAYFCLTCSRRITRKYYLVIQETCKRSSLLKPVMGYNSARPMLRVNNQRLQFYSYCNKSEFAESVTPVKGGKMTRSLCKS